MSTSTSTVDEMFADLPARMTRREAAAATGTGVRTIDRWVAEGQLRAFRLGGRVLIAKSDLLAMVEPVRAAG